VNIAVFPSAPTEAGLQHRILASVRRRVVGHARAVERLLVALLAGGHVLLEGVPGLAKTLLARTLADTLDASFRRIQFTPDLLPSDILGSMIFQKETGSFVPAPGPIFANVVLADEINRAPPRVQSALLESMEERQISLGDQTFPLREPFLVLATQNPLEHHGTYPLAEAQIDRFMMHLELGYPDRAEEKEILRLACRPPGGEMASVVSSPELLEAREAVQRIHVDDRIQDYVVEIVQGTRDPGAAGLPEMAPLLDAGASPRGGIHLQEAARARAYLQDRSYVVPEDIKRLAPDVLRHRLILTVEARAQGVGPDTVLRQILSRTPVP
jgi:MoxR-like ATPase